MIDLHCHALPGIDDGPPDLAGSLALARAAAAAGIDTLVATPHVNARYRNDAATIAPLVQRLNEALRDEAIPLRVLPGAEIAVTIVAELAPGQLARLSLGDGGWLLIEPPFSAIVTMLDAIVAGLQERGHRVLLAHPERCPAFHREPEIVARLVARGVRTSVTAGSLVGQFGGHTRRFALELLDAELVHNVTSDAHDAVDRPPGIARELDRAGYGELTEWLAQDVPRAILAGEAELPARPAASARPARRWSLRRGG